MITHRVLVLLSAMYVGMGEDDDVQNRHQRYACQ